MTVKPAVRVEQALAALARRHRIPLDPTVIRLFARTAVDALAHVDVEPREIPAGDMPSPGDLTTLRLVANGGTVVYLAKVTHRSVDAVDQELRRICRRMGARTLTQAIAVCMARGWILASDVRAPAGRPRGKSGPKPEAVA